MEEHKINSINIIFDENTKFFELYIKKTMKTIFLIIK